MFQIVSIQWFIHSGQSCISSSLKKGASICSKLWLKDAYPFAHFSVQSRAWHRTYEEWSHRLSLVTAMTGRCSLTQICNLNRDNKYSKSKYMYLSTNREDWAGVTKARVPGEMPPSPFPNFQSFKFWQRRNKKCDVKKIQDRMCAIESTSPYFNVKLISL